MLRKQGVFRCRWPCRLSLLRHCHRSIHHQRSSDAQRDNEVQTFFPRPRRVASGLPSLQCARPPVDMPACPSPTLSFHKRRRRGKRNEAALELRGCGLAAGVERDGWFVLWRNKCPPLAARSFVRSFVRSPLMAASCKDTRKGTLMTGVSGFPKICS